MAKYNFYNGYSIDDSNISCDSIIVAECPTSGSDMPNHVYKSICELIADCPAIHQLQKDCVVDFFNRDWSSQYDGNVPKFIKLNSSGCLEWGTLECPCSDELVKASACDRKAGYLEDKLEGGTSDNGLYSIDVNTVSCDKIEISPDGPDNTYIRARNVPSEGSGNIRYKNGNIYYDEDLDTETTSNISYARRYHGGGIAVVRTNEWANIWGVNNGETSPKGYTFNSSYTTLKGTKDIVRGTGRHIFGLTRPGIYVLSLNCCLKNENENWLKAIRGGLVLDAAGTSTSRYAGITCGDFKYDSRRYTQQVNEFYPNGDSSDATGKLRLLELGIMSFCTSYVLHLEAASPDSPVRVCFRIRCDTRMGEGDINRDPRITSDPGTVTLTLTNDSDFEPGSVDADTPNQGTNTTITCARIGEYPRIRDL